MDKESYSIEDIINEARRAREDKAKNPPTPAPPAEEPAAEAPAEEPVPGEEAADEPPVEETPVEENDLTALVENDLTGEALPAEEEMPEAELSLTEETAEEAVKAASEAEVATPVTEDDSTGNTDEVTPEPQEETADEPQDEPAQDAAAEPEEGMVDIINYTEPEPEEEAPEEEPHHHHREHHSEKKRHRKTTAEKVTIGVIIALVVAIVFALGYYFLLPYLNMSDRTQHGDNSPINMEWSGMKEDIRNFPLIEEADAGEVSSLQDMMKSWYMNGAPCSATHVLNVLLIGEDTRGSDVVDEDTRADSAIIVSVNIDTQTVTLTSVLRDTYAYWQITPGNEETGVYEKINASMALEGCSIETYISCIENLYKIDIDNYAIVNFECFASIIDELGGVTITMTSAEINEINNHPTRYGDIGEVYIEKTFDGNEGEVDLDGKQALAYCRIRKLDSDNQRAERQKTCLNQMFLKMKDASNTELLKVVNTLAPYVKTGFSTKELLSITRYALSNDWLQFDIQSTTVPHNRINESGAGGTYYGFWCWKSDYPADAYYLQTLLYGETGITLAQNRVDILRCRETGYLSDGMPSVLASGASIYNLDYMVPTTYEITRLNEEEEITE